MSKQRCGKKSGAGEEGFVLITVMLVMILLLGLAIVTLDSTVVEMNIASNNRGYTTTFYKAEGAAMEIIQFMESNKNQLDLLPKYMAEDSAYKCIQTLSPEYGVYPMYSQYSRIEAWAKPGNLCGSQLLNNIANPTVSSAVLYREPSRDDSGVDNPGRGTRMYEYLVYGQAQEGNTPVIIAALYRVRM